MAELTRRALMERAALAGIGALVAQAPGLLGARGLLDEALAQSDDLVTETFAGLAAFMLPGDDPYSVAQGVTAEGPGGVGSGAVPVLIGNLDAYIPLAALGPGQALPASGGVAALLNAYAVPAGAPPEGEGSFLAPFANLSFNQKAEAMRLLEGEVLFDGTELKFVGGILPGFITFLIFSEAGVFDADKRRVTERPVGWEIADYKGVAEGRRELRGYWRGHRRSKTPARTRRWQRRSGKG